MGSVESKATTTSSVRAERLKSVDASDRSASASSNEKQLFNESVKAAREEKAAQTAQLEKFDNASRTWVNFVELARKGAPVDPAKMTIARRDLYESFLHIGRIQAEQGGGVLERAKAVAGGTERFEALGRSAGVDWTRFEVLTSDAVNAGDPKRADEVGHLATKVRKEFDHRRLNGMAADATLQSLGEKLRHYSQALSVLPASVTDHDRFEIRTLASTTPVTDTVADRGQKMKALALDVAKAVPSAVLESARNTVNVIDDAGDWLNEKLPLPSLRILNDRGELDVGFETITDPDKVGLRMPDVRPEWMKPETGAGKVVETGVQFLAGWRIAGEVLAASKWGPATTFWGGAARGTTQGALADGLAFDPRNPRLSNLIDPEGKYPITNILSAKPEDSALEGRLKNSAEGVLIGNVISGLKLAKDSAASIPELISRLKSGSNTIDNAILKRIMDKYPSLDDASQDGLRKFAAKSLNLAEEKLTLKNPVEGSADAAGAKGVSGAPVFLVRDENGQISGVIKKFPEKLLPVMGAELVSMQTLKNLGLRQSHSITALEGAKLPDGGALLLSPASGSAIDDLFERAGRLPDGPERQVAINELRDAMRRIGVAGAELHTVPPGSAVRPATALQEHIGIVKEKLEKIVAALPKLKLEKGSERLSARDLQTRVDELIEGVKRNPGAASVIHGDFHPGNIFFDKEKGVTLIDLGRLHESLDVGGRPIGPPARDYAGFHQEITHFGRILKLRDSEIDELSNIFKEAYQRKGPALTDEATRFFRARTAMGEFIKVVITKNESSPAAISDEVRILKRALNIR